MAGMFVAGKFAPRWLAGGSGGLAVHLFQALGLMFLGRFWLLLTMGAELVLSCVGLGRV
jgi:hypothetical protein